MSTIFDCAYNVDGVDRYVIFRVPGTPGAPGTPVGAPGSPQGATGPVLPNDVVIWVHGGHMDGFDMMTAIPRSSRRIDVFPTALKTNGGVSGTYPNLATDCTVPRGWALGGMPTATAPFAPGVGCTAYVGPPAVPVQYGADPMVPRRVMQAAFAGGSGLPDTWTDLRFLCLLVRKTRLGDPPSAAGWLSVGYQALAAWNVQGWNPRFWFAGFSKGGMLVLWAHAYNLVSTIPATVPGSPNGPPGWGGTNDDFNELADVSGYFFSSAAMPDTTIQLGTMDNFANLTVRPRVCGYWHGGVDEDTTRQYLPGLSFADSAIILAQWYGVQWTPWRLHNFRPQVCQYFFAPPASNPNANANAGYVRKQFANDVNGIRVLERYQVIDGTHNWTRPIIPAVGAPCPNPLGDDWDEALVATNLWRKHGYGA